MKLNHGEILKILIGKSGKSYEDFASDLGITRTTLYVWVSSAILKDRQLKILKDAGYDIENSDLKIETEKNESNNHVQIPIYDVDISAGLVDYAELDSENTIGYMLYDKKVAKGIEGFVRITGESMEPVYSHADFVGFKTINNVDEIEYGQTYIIQTDNHSMIKVIKKSEKEGYVNLYSHNQNFDPFDIDIKRIKRLYLVTGKM